MISVMESIWLSVILAEVLLIWGLVVAIPWKGLGPAAPTGLQQRLKGFSRILRLFPSQFRLFPTRRRGHVPDQRTVLLLPKDWNLEVFEPVCTFRSRCCGIFQSKSQDPISRHVNSERKHLQFRTASAPSHEACRTCRNALEYAF